MSICTAVCLPGLQVEEEQCQQRELAQEKEKMGTAFAKLKTLVEEDADTEAELVKVMAYSLYPSTQMSAQTSRMLMLYVAKKCARYHTAKNRNCFARRTFPGDLPTQLFLQRDKAPASSPSCSTRSILFAGETAMRYYRFNPRRSSWASSPPRGRLRFG